MGDLTGFLSNITECITSISSWFVTAMGIFMEPPLVVFVAFGLFGSAVYLAKSLIRG